MASTDDLWFALAQQIQQHAAPALDPSKEQFSFGSVALQIDIGNPDPLIAAGAIYELGNTIPAFSPDYIAGSNLLSTFNIFLSAIDLKGSTNPNLDPLINSAAAAFNAAQTNYNSVLGAALAQYAVYKAAFPNVTFSDFASQQYPTYGLAASALAAAQMKLTGLMTQKYGVGYQVIATAINDAGPTTGAGNPLTSNSFNMAAKLGNAALPGSTPSLPGTTGTPPTDNLTSVCVPLFQLEGFASVWPSWQQASVSGTTGAKITVNSAVGDSNWSQMGWTQQSMSTVDAFFFDSVSQSSSSGTSNSTMQFEDQWTVEIDFVALSVFSIQAGPWFDLGIVQTFKNQLLPGSPSLFGASGSLARVPEQAVIGFQPTVKMSLSNRDYNTFKQTAQSSSSSGFGIGPFYVSESSSSSYSSMSDVNFDDSGATITITPPPTTVPLLLGVISTRLDV